MMKEKNHQLKYEKLVKWTNKHIDSLRLEKIHKTQVGVRSQKMAKLLIKMYFEPAIAVFP